MIAENRQTPLLAGWAIAAAAGLVAAAVSFVVGGLSPLQCCFVGALIFAVVGLILGLPGRVQAAAGEPVDTMLRPLDPQPVAGPSVVVAAAAMPGMGAAARRPAGLNGARNGSADDLKRIKGVGPKLEQLCHSLGFYHFDQIAGWTADEISWVDDNLEGFKGRVTRDDWVAQARILAAGGTTEFADRVDKGDVY